MYVLPGLMPLTFKNKNEAIAFGIIRLCEKRGTDFTALTEEQVERASTIVEQKIVEVGK